MSEPDPRRAVAQYRRHAAGYDASARRTMALRRRAVEWLGLSPGERVLDVACGTGLSLPLLAERVGPAGRVVGVELSPDMIQRARERVAQAGLTQVELVEAPMQDAALEGRFDAVLFNYTHDVLQSPRALARVFAHVRPGARVVSVGVKHPPVWLFPLRLLRLWKARPYLTTFRGLARPWAPLEPYVEGMEIRPLMLNTNYMMRAQARIRP
ncbi:MAG TPA: methyltransferase domain-containing protein [Burkholderiales bacterium]|nr:methyltransferase domain-containing protein [Burkholderiales bacterium]